MSRVFEAAKKTTGIANEIERSFKGELHGEAAPKVRGPEVVPAPDPALRADTPVSTPYRTVSIQAFGPSPILPFEGKDHQAAERYRILRTRIVHNPRQVRLLCISSTTPRDGKTVTTVNLGASLALKKQTTALVVDVDMRRPQLAKLLGIPEKPGLAEYLAGRCTLAETIVQIDNVPNLYVLPSGQHSGNPTELLDSERWRTATEFFRTQFDYTVMDSPPIGPVADYDLIQDVCDGVILVVRPRHSNRALLQKGINQMTDKFLGAVINCAEDWFLWRVHEGSYYDYSSPDPEHSSGR
jgi:capsular exopolysaccharide synthesis family protein